MKGTTAITNEELISLFFHVNAGYLLDFKNTVYVKRSEWIVLIVET